MGDSFAAKGFVALFDPTCLVIKVTRIVLHKADQPYPVLDLLNPYFLSSKGLGDIDLLSSQADAAAARHGDGSVMEGILKVG